MSGGVPKLNEGGGTADSSTRTIRWMPPRSNLPAFRKEHQNQVISDSKMSSWVLREPKMTGVNWRKI
jgi:hypothetical protein